MECLHLNQQLVATWIDKMNSDAFKTINKPSIINFTTDLVDLHNIEPLPKSKMSWLSFLQSNLQKAIRRNKSSVAVNTAKEMTRYHGGWTKLIRRLGIIVVEDKLAGLDLNYSTLVWLTAVAPYRNTQLEQWVFNYVLFLCNQKYQDVAPIELKYKPKSQIARSLTLRSYYGGMPCDIRLLKAASYQFSEINLSNNGKLPAAKPTPLKILLWYAGDFHCFPDLLTHLENTFGYSTDELRKIIWYNSSGLRTGYITKKYKPKIWKEIKNTMREYSVKKILDCIPEVDPLESKKNKN